MSLSFTNAAEFLSRTARPLELRAYETIFDGASFDGFAAALRKFRWPDGGFGNALEPDVRTPYSQPLFVDFALKCLYQVGARESEFGEGVCDYLRLVSESNGALPYLLPNALEYPRAKQWQTLHPPSLELTFGITAMLHWLGVEDAWLYTATESCWLALDAPPDDAHALIGVMQFLEHAPQRLEQESILTHILEFLPRARWLSLELPVKGYALTPLHLAPNPNALAYRCFSDTMIEAHLDALVAQQENDGGWPLSWEPPGEVARSEWRGRWTLDALVVLNAYGRL